MARVNPSYKENPVDWDRLFETFKDHRRRQILTALMTDPARWQDEFETEEFRSTETERAAAAINLHHCHLPQLEEAGVIDWDRTTGLITRGEHYEMIRPVLEFIDDFQDQLSDDGP